MGWFDKVGREARKRPILNQRKKQWVTAGGEKKVTVRFRRRTLGSGGELQEIISSTTTEGKSYAGEKWAEMEKRDLHSSQRCPVIKEGLDSKRKLRIDGESGGKGGSACGYISGQKAERNTKRRKFGHGAGTFHN